LLMIDGYELKSWYLRIPSDASLVVGFQDVGVRHRPPTGMHPVTQAVKSTPVP
jgi:hypothetical protein